MPTAALRQPVRIRDPELADLPASRFASRFVDALPADPLRHNRPRQVREACYTRVDPTPVRAPRLLAWAAPVGELLGLARPDDPAGASAAILGGNRLHPAMAPYAARYGGHQFGHWAGQLGDGRAITLAELHGADGQRYELQLKGAGPTPYSRSADGRAVLRSSVREFLCSEAMHALGVPTTRALSLVGTGEAVVRDMFYDGNPQAEPGAVVCRVAPSFVRFGNFQIHAAHDETDSLQRLLAYVMAEHFPGFGAPTPDNCARWFAEVCRRTALLLVEWMRVGFVHGVMNTDNMSILGLTIDYGPYGWLEGFDPEWTPNTTDAQGRRYCYGRQPAVAQWNLARLAEALLPLVGDLGALQDGLRSYRDTYEAASRAMLAAKLGLRELAGAADEALLDGLFASLQATETDMTLFFRGLAAVPLQPDADDAALLAPLRPAFYAERPATAELLGWLRRHAERVRADGEVAASRARRMQRVNPKYVPRNYLAQQAIEALADGDATLLERLLAVLGRPYDEQPDAEDLAARRPEWARHRAGCSALSCSS